AQAIKGVDVVFSALGTDGTTTLTEAMPLIIEAMEQEGVKRIITIGTAGILQSRTDIDLLRYESNESKRKTTRAAKEHHKVYELLDQSTHEWTIVYTNNLPGNSVQNSITHTVESAYQQLNDNEYVKSRVGIAY